MARHTTSSLLLMLLCGPALCHAVAALKPGPPARAPAVMAATRQRSCPPGSTTCAHSIYMCDTRARWGGVVAVLHCNGGRSSSVPNRAPTSSGRDNETRTHGNDSGCRLPCHGPPCFPCVQECCCYTCVLGSYTCALAAGTRRTRVHHHACAPPFPLALPYAGADFWAGAPHSMRRPGAPGVAMPRTREVTREEQTAPRSPHCPTAPTACPCRPSDLPPRGGTCRACRRPCPAGQSCRGPR